MSDWELCFLCFCTSFGGILKGVLVPSPLTGVLTVISCKRCVVSAMDGVSLLTLVFEVVDVAVFLLSWLSSSESLNLAFLCLFGSFSGAIASCWSCLSCGMGTVSTFDTVDAVAVEKSKRFLSSDCPSSSLRSCWESFLSFFVTSFSFSAFFVLSLSLRSSWGFYSFLFLLVLLDPFPWLMRPTWKITSKNLTTLWDPRA